MKLVNLQEGLRIKGLRSSLDGRKEFGDICKTRGAFWKRNPRINLLWSLEFMTYKIHEEY